MQNETTNAVNDNKPTCLDTQLLEKEFETMRQRLVDVQAKRLAHKIERARFNKAWVSIGQVSSH